MRVWAGSWSDRFDLATADLLVQQTAGAVPAPVRLVLGLTAGGVEVKRGFLPRAFVRQVQESYPSWDLLDRPGWIEDVLWPLERLSDLLREVGLLRLSKGVLSPTRAAADDSDVIRRLRSWFGPVYGFTSMLSGDAVALLSAEGPSRPQDLAGRLLHLLGSRWITSEGERLDEELTLRDLRRLEAVLVGLDLIEVSEGVWTAGPSARSLLPRATALAHLWSRR